MKLTGSARGRHAVLPISSLLVLIVLVLITGAASSSGSMVGVVILLSLLGSGVVAIYPRLLLWVVILGGLVVAGLVRLYVPQLNFLAWIVSGMCYLLVFQLIAILFRQTRGDAAQRTVPAVIWLACLFFCSAALATAANNVALSTLVVGAKGYFQVWPLLFALILVQWSEKTILLLPKALLWIALLQIPFVAHEYLVLVPARVGMGYGIVPVDIVAGTFGAEMSGGGSNSTLAMFLIIVWSGVLAAWKFGQLSGLALVTLGALLLFPLFLNESKTAIVYLTVVYVWLFRGDIIRRPHMFLLGATLVAVLVLGLLMSYVAVHSEHGFQSYVEETIRNNFSTVGARSRWSPDLNRYTVYTFWVQQHGLDNPIQTLFGHGLGESKESPGLIQVTNLASTRYPGVGIGRTAWAALLWDVGLVGTSLVIAMFWWAWRTAGHLACRFQGRSKLCAHFVGLEAIIPIIVLSLAHSPLFVFELPTQTLILGVLGFIGYWDRHAQVRTAARSLSSNGATP